ncbi:hypothetical protein GCM10027521_66690 [Amycolatopsis cihanbeyliensis]
MIDLFGYAGESVAECLAPAAVGVAALLVAITCGFCRREERPLAEYVSERPSRRLWLGCPQHGQR